MLNLYTLKNSHYFTIPDLGKGLPSFESLIQALSKNGRVSIVSDYRAVGLLIGSPQKLYEKGRYAGHL